MLSENILRFATYDNNSCEIVVQDGDDKIHMIADYREVIRFKKHGENTKAKVKIFEDNRCVSEEEYDISEKKKRTELKRSDGSILVVENIERLWANENSTLREDITSRNGECCAYLMYEDNALVRAVSQNEKHDLESGYFRERINSVLGRGDTLLKVMGLGFELLSIALAILVGALMFDPNTPLEKLVFTTAIFILSKALSMVCRYKVGLLGDLSHLFGFLKSSKKPKLSQD